MYQKTNHHFKVCRFGGIFATGLGFSFLADLSYSEQIKL